MLETITDPKRTNIGNLHLEEPGKAVYPHFNAEEDISPQEWRLVSDSFSSIRREVLYGTGSGGMLYLDNLSNSSLLSAPGASYLLSLHDVDSDEVMWVFNTVTKQLIKDEEWGSGPLVSAYAYLNQIRSFFPDLESPTIKPADWQNWRFQLNTIQQDEDWDDFLSFGANMKLAMPSVRFNTKKIEQAWNPIKMDLEDSAANANEYFTNASKARIMFPEHFKEITIKKSQWEEAHNVLHNLVNSQTPTDSLALAVSMQILAAEQLEITNEGLKLTMPKNEPQFQLKTPALPEMRKF
ncbi:MAG: hypothetical protein Q7R49_01705 [Candidatus Daviesbacteria bacterium]|nr:hypothetical protein [Candidatus Daviesbacteria bacterium]